MNKNMKNEGILKKAGNFLGISKFGQGLATATRVLTGEVGDDIARQEENTSRVNKIVYAAKQETDPAKRQKLLQLAQSMGTGTSASDIDSGLNLSNREVLGSAANVVLNVATPGAFKGGKLATIGKNAALGAGFGAASGMEKDRSLSGIVGSAVGGGLVGGAIGSVALLSKAAKQFFSETTPKWLMDKAIKPTLDETRKAIKFGQETLGDELLKEGVKGSPERLLTIADNQLGSLEKELQAVLSKPELNGVKITREQIASHLTDLIETKAGTPGLKGDVQRIKNIIDDIPEQLTLQEANQMKRRIYQELRDVSYKLDAKLSTKAGALKKVASGLKQEIEKAVGGDTVKNINQKLSLYGRLEDRVVDQMARNMRNNSFGLTDAILTGGGIASLSPLGVLAGLSAAGAKHLAGSTRFRTTAAQGLNKLQSVGTGKVGQIIKGTVKRAGLNLP